MFCSQSRNQEPCWWRRAEPMMLRYWGRLLSPGWTIKGDWRLIGVVMECSSSSSNDFLSNRSSLLLLYFAKNFEVPQTSWTKQSVQVGVGAQSCFPHLLVVFLLHLPQLGVGGLHIFSRSMPESSPSHSKILLDMIYKRIWSMISNVLPDIKCTF